jgi:NADH-quinone oxidoreductase subunit M
MDHGGVASTRPVLTTMIVIASMASVGLPGLNGFVGEFMILSGAFDSTQLGSTLYAVLAALAVILAAMYTLRLLKFTLFGSPQHEFQPEDTDRSTLPKGWVLGTFVVIMVWIGFQSPTFTQFSQEWTIILLDHVQGILSTSGLLNVSPETSVPFVS